MSSAGVLFPGVRGGAGAVVMLVRSDDGEEWVTMARDDGGYRFIDLSPGGYSVRVHPAGTHRENIVLDGRNQVEADLAMTGWGYTVRIADDIQKVGAIVVTTPGRKGLRVQAHSAEWSSEAVLTGAVPEYGEHAAIITPLEVDYYMVTVDGAEDETGKPTQLEARVHVDKRAVPWVEFVFTPVADAQPATSSRVLGVVIGARRGQPVQVQLADDQAQRRTALVDDRGHFVFDGLSAGSYQLAVIGFEDATRSSNFALDGKNQVEVEIALPGLEPAAAPRAGASIVTGVAPASAGRLARLLDAVGNEHRAIVDGNDRFAFEALPAGMYTVLVEGGFQQGSVELDGANAVEIQFAPVIAVWETTISEIGSMPGFSSLRVEVEGMPDLPVRVTRQDEDGQVARTSKDPERGAFFVEFRPLGPGLYVVEPESLGIWTPVELTGLEAIAVSFRRTQSAVSPNTVRQLSAVESRYADLGYLFLASAPATPAQLERLLRLVSARALPFGMDVDVAAQCPQILLLDDGSAAGDELALRLGMRGADVIRSRGNWDLIFDELGA
ncbi:MAG: carboxypeptidase regulatory-like domain-containing protein [Anaerolineales bacterium]|nr:carboxypeptidase regulatory-like domain-containing protein [Anaerolineales bacterium]